MHNIKYRSAARSAAWWEEEGDPPSYNPFRNMHQRRRQAYTIAGDFDDGVSGTAWVGPTQTVSETNLAADALPVCINSVRCRKPRRDSDSEGKIKNAGAPPGDTLGEGGPEVDHLDITTTGARSRPRNIFRLNTTHGLLKKEHTHIGQKIGEIGRSIAAHGYPAVKEATLHTLERKALVIDFEKDVGRAKGDRIPIHHCVQLTSIPLDSSSAKTKSNGGPHLYPCSQARTLFSGLAILHHPSFVSTRRPV